MTYRIEFKPRAAKDLDALDRSTARRVMEKIRGLEDDLVGLRETLDQLHTRISFARR